MAAIAWNPPLSLRRDRWSAQTALARAPHSPFTRPAPRALSYQTRAKAWPRVPPLRPEVCGRRHALAGRGIRATGPPAARANMDEANSEPQTKKRRRLEPPQTTPVAVVPDGQTTRARPNGCVVKPRLKARRPASSRLPQIQLTMFLIRDINRRP
ncbi:hypothetical protein HPB50_005843 [Hyalomma asiaticum]|uniref:Uncharacterized protein n=1 Tax=Hyalomma asiaticum TaxID=266040 RepID=A0ACB7S6S3_HYAAI|nr:hypothetical protein HPB50_005843 [Hyalomma asiaticum]